MSLYPASILYLVYTTLEPKEGIKVSKYPFVGLIYSKQKPAAWFGAPKNGRRNLNKHLPPFPHATCTRILQRFRHWENYPPPLVLSQGIQPGPRNRSRSCIHTIASPKTNNWACVGYSLGALSRTKPQQCVKLPPSIMNPLVVASKLTLSLREHDAFGSVALILLVPINFGHESLGARLNPDDASAYIRILLLRHPSFALAWITRASRRAWQSFPARISSWKSTSARQFAFVLGFTLQLLWIPYRIDSSTHTTFRLTVTTQRNHLTTSMSYLINSEIRIHSDIEIFSPGPVAAGSTDHVRQGIGDGYSRSTANAAVRATQTNRHQQHHSNSSTTGRLCIPTYLVEYLTVYVVDSLRPLSHRSEKPDISPPVRFCPASYLDFFFGEPETPERIIDWISSTTGERRDVYLYEYFHCRPVHSGLITPPRGQISPNAKHRITAKGTLGLRHHNPNEFAGSRFIPALHAESIVIRRMNKRVPRPDVNLPRRVSPSGLTPKMPTHVGSHPLEAIVVTNAALPSAGQGSLLPARLSRTRAVLTLPLGSAYENGNPVASSVTTHHTLAGFQAAGPNEIHNTKGFKERNVQTS
ncbi:uncharacterized protein CLUP02_12245 [Colletotrichum lupini]|uniref:Uncharacterized protein n=1 Tax=Colletotrichum lupini TaxID=145971 RepID=A0A9Q8T043_9PEZI|nr:uncharacterized protein CLUP02_12245 [Colletotrichum lupini]UQC86743.1 hypothetical protein CLUP02_12245 [Colletotrichum lupini]